MKKILLILMSASMILLTACSQSQTSSSSSIQSSSSEVEELPSCSDTVPRPRFENPDLKDFTKEEIESKNMLAEDGKVMKIFLSTGDLGEANEILAKELDINEAILLGLQMGYAIEQEEMDQGSFIGIIGLYSDLVIANMSDQDMLSYIYNPDYNDAFKFLILDYFFTQRDSASMRGDVDHIARQLAEDKSMSQVVRLQAAHAILDRDYSIDLRNEIRNED